MLVIIKLVYEKLYRRRDERKNDCALNKKKGNKINTKDKG